GAALRHFEDHREWREARPAGQVALVEDYSEARLSAGLFDMMAAKHVPVFSAPAGSSPGNARIVVNPENKTVASSGAAVIDGPPPSGKAAQGEAEFVFDPTDTRVDMVWQRVSAAMGRQNLGARLFNVASMLSNVLELRGERQLVLHLVNYSDYPASGITARVVGNYRRARLYRPGEAPVDLEVEKIEDGSGFSIDQRITTIATVVLE
ncbi:MAG: hypothetical protein KGN84_17690, partial [Acidobacteriota bacterium]|nr:hypothetical protein [Acidobacteriota bacterium]